MKPIKLFSFSIITVILCSCNVKNERTKDIHIERVISIKGSETIRTVIEKFVKNYESENPQVVLDYTGGGSVIGLMSFVAKETDLAFVSRELNQEERKTLGKRDAVVDTIAIDGLSIILNVNNPVKQLSLKQLSLIYSGKIKNWNEVGGENYPITLYSRDISSGTYAFFKEKVLDSLEYSATDINLTHNEEIVSNVSSTKNAIGYVGLSYTQNPMIKVIPIVFADGQPAFAPNYQNIKSNNYQLKRHIVMIYARKSDEHIKKLILAFKNENSFNLINESGLIPYRNSFN